MDKYFFDKFNIANYMQQLPTARHRTFWIVLSSPAQCPWLSVGTDCSFLISISLSINKNIAICFRRSWVQNSFFFNYYFLIHRNIYIFEEKNLFFLQTPFFRDSKQTPKFLDTMKKKKLHKRKWPNPLLKTNAAGFNTV